MLVLGAAITVHPVRVNHQFKLVARFLKCIYQLQGILEVNIIITGAVSELQRPRGRTVPLLV